MLNFAVGLQDQVSGPAKQASGSLSSLGGSLEALADPAALAATALALLTAAAVGVGAALYEGAQIALEASDAYGDMVTQFDALTGRGEDAVDMLDSVSAHTPKSRKELAEWADVLAAAGETDLGELDRSLTAIASAESLMGSHGKEAAAGVKSLLERVLEAEMAGQGLKLADKQLVKLAQTGVNVDDVAKKMGLSAKTLRDQLKAGTADAAKFGDALQEALIEKGAGALAGNMEDLPVQITKAKEGFTKLFEGVDTSGFLHALTSITGMFDQSSTSGKALKWVITTIFNNLFSLGEKVLPYVHLFFLKMINAGLRIYIIFKPVIKQFSDLWDQVDAGGDSIGLMDIFVTSLIGMATVMSWVATVSAYLWEGIFWWVNFVWDTLMGLIDTIVDLWDQFTGMADTASKMGGDLVDGLVGGITANAQKVIDAMVELASNALGAAKKKLGISSPSKAMIEMGGYMGEGMAIGVSNAANDVENAVGSVATQAMAAVPAGAAPASSSSGGVNVYIEAGAIVVSGSGSAMDLTEQAAALMFERIALSQGLGNAA